MLLSSKAWGRDHCTTIVPLIPGVGVEDDRSDIGSVLVLWKWDMMA